MGFHWPPLVMVDHLHMHVIAPESKIKFIGKMLFKKNSRWFVSPQDLVKWLNRAAQ